jgi:hypothetical protein
MEQGMRQQPNLFDTAILFVFLVGLYTNFAVELGPKVPIPAIIAGGAGIVLLLRHAGWVEQRHVIGLIGIITLYLVSVFFAPDLRMTDERLKGVFQLTYSLVLGYAFFLIARRYERPRLARLFLALCLMLLVGTALENYTAFRNISDQARSVMFDFGNYDSDVRDEFYYGMVRPKLFTSEPSYLAFGYTMFAFGWYGISTWRLKLPVYLAGLAAGFLLMRSPTIFLGALLVLPYELFLASRRADGGYHLTRGIVMTIASAVILIAAAWAASNTLAVRLREIQDGGDPSFFTRQIAPVLVAKDTFARHPLTGIGITSEEAVADRLLSIFIRSPAYSPEWNIGEDPARLITNYFWHHWIYFGLGWGLLLVLGLHWMLRQMGVTSVAFCWIAWIVFGQSMGAYVSPRVWFVMFLAATIVSLHDVRVPVRRLAPVPVPRPTVLRRATRVVGA